MTFPACRSFVASDARRRGKVSNGLNTKIRAFGQRGVRGDRAHSSPAPCNARKSPSLRKTIPCRGHEQRTLNLWSSRSVA